MHCSCDVCHCTLEDRVGQWRIASRHRRRMGEPDQVGQQVLDCCARGIGQRRRRHHGIGHVRHGIGGRVRVRIVDRVGPGRTAQVMVFARGQRCCGCREARRVRRDEISGSILHRRRAQPEELRLGGVHQAKACARVLRAGRLRKNTSAVAIGPHGLRLQGRRLGWRVVVRRCGQRREDRVAVAVRIDPRRALVRRPDRRAQGGCGQCCWRRIGILHRHRGGNRSTTWRIRVFVHRHRKRSVRRRAQPVGRLEARPAGHVGVEGAEADRSEVARGHPVQQVERVVPHLIGDLLRVSLRARTAGEHGARDRRAGGLERGHQVVRQCELRLGRWCRRAVRHLVERGDESGDHVRGQVVAVDGEVLSLVGSAGQEALGGTRQGHWDKGVALAQQ